MISLAKTKTLPNGAIYHDVQQNTPEWLQLRCGKVGGSSIAKIMAHIGKPLGNPAIEYASKIALERVTGVPVYNNYTNAHMERGHKEEPEARKLYEEWRFVEVSNGGFVELGGRGVSPDGFPGKNIIEIKSRIPEKQFKTLENGRFDRDCKWQLIFNGDTCGADVVDYISYCSSFPPGKQLFIDSIVMDDYHRECGQIQERLEMFEAVVSEYIQKIMEL
jgi:hypothetical protein